MIDMVTINLNTTPTWQKARLKRKKIVDQYKENQDEAKLLMVYQEVDKTTLNLWYLDTSYNYHVCGYKSIFLQLDKQL